MRFNRVLQKMIIACICIVFLGCNSGESSNQSKAPDKNDHKPQEDHKPPEVAWEPCPFITEVCPEGEGLHCFSDDSTLDAECAFVQLPASYNDPSGPTIEVFLKRKKAKKPSAGQLWMLAGGPGSNLGLEGVAEVFEELRDDLDIYLVEHRGFGRSSILRCPEQEAENSPGGETITIDELADCASFLEEKYGSLEYFRTTYAAYDVDRLIRATRETDDEVYVYGISYGTYWLNRFLQITSQHMDGLIFDGGAGPETSLNSTTEILGIDAVGRELLWRCTEDANCNSYLPNPEETLAKLYQTLDTGHCSESGISGKGFKALVHGMLSDVGVRDYIPSFIHRVNRCEQRDIEAVTSLLSGLGQLLGSTNHHNTTLQQHNSFFASEHISFGDLWDDAELRFEERVELKDTLFPQNQSESDDYREAWPSIYKDDEFAGQIASTDIPVLFLQGTLDAQTPHETADPFGLNFDGPYQNYIHVYDAAHGVLLQSPLADDPEMTCGMDLTAQFLNDPKAELDTSCVYGVKPLNFNGDPLMTKTLYGTENAWE